MNCCICVRVGFSRVQILDGALDTDAETCTVQARVTIDSANGPNGKVPT